MHHDTCRRGLVNLTVSRESFLEKLIRRFLREVHLPVLLRNCGAPAADNDTFASLIENLGNAGQQRCAIETPVKADAYIAHRQVGTFPRQSPRNTVGFIVEGRMYIPGACRLILKLPASAALLLLSPL